jgi:hypothetical protein
MPTSAQTWSWAGPWWSALVAVNVLSLLACVFLFARPIRHVEPGDVRYVKIMRAMGLIFAVVALYRSIFVSSYLHQLAWFDSVLNSSLLIRSLAIFAELSFAGLITLTLRRLNHDIPELVENQRPFRTFLQTKTPIVLFTCILIANVFATAATITKIDLLFALEETCWGIGFVSIIPMLILSLRVLRAGRGTQRWHEQRQLRRAVVMIAVFAIGYAIFELGFNLPVVYWPEAIGQLQMATPEPAFRFGASAVRDAFLVVHQTRSLDDWGGMGFVVWHSGYFSICVWMVLFLMTRPRLLREAASTRVHREGEEGSPLEPATS